MAEGAFSGRTLNVVTALPAHTSPAAEVSKRHLEGWYMTRKRCVQFERFGHQYFSGSTREFCRKSEMDSRDSIVVTANSPV